MNRYNYIKGYREIAKQREKEHKTIHWGGIIGGLVLIALFYLFIWLVAGAFYTPIN